MPDAVTFAELFGGVFPAEPQVEVGVEYGPLGDDLTGTAVLADAAQLQILDTLSLLGIEGTWAIQRTFETATGDKIPGVRTSLVGVANKSSVSGSDGITRIKTDDGTYTLRVVVPVGYEDVPDVPVVISGADDVGVVVLTAVPVAVADAPLCAVVLPVVDQYGVPLAGVDVEITFASFESGASPTAVVVNPKQAIPSNSEGFVSVNLLRFGKYSASYTPPGQQPKRIAFTVPNEASYVVVEAS
jgi:hypothetical protein